MAALSTTSSATDAAETHLPLPPPVLPPRQLKKIEISCRKWLVRFLLAVSSVARAQQTGAAVATTSSFGSADVEGSGESRYDVGGVATPVCPAWKQANGFVALNGGILAGCSPHDLRATLVAHHLLQPPIPSSNETILAYSSTLPFVLCARPLALQAEADTRTGLFALYVSAEDITRCTATTRASSEAEGHSTSAPDSLASGRCVESGKPAVADRSGEKNRSDSTFPPSVIGVVVLQLPPAASLWKGGSSTSSAQRGCGFLYLLPCDVSLMRTMLRCVLQKPVVGIERLLGHGERAERAHDDEDKRPRVCVSQAVPGIPGLYLVEDFLTRGEEAAIWAELHEGRQRLQLEYLSRRRVAHFNRRFIYGANQLTTEGEEVNARPSFYDWMRARLQNNDPAHSMRIVGDYPFHPGDYECDQLTVNYYDYSEMGACGIASHVDAHAAFEDAILIVSLGSYTVMDYTRWDTPAAEAAAPIGVYLPRRSLAVMHGESRYGWTHCIAEKRTDTVSELLPTLTRGDRLSLTWRRGRTQRHLKAECPFPALCDGE
ncbi:hypothetical protein ABB37_00826 [Leptomonas pyrrhocoris]|uniref:Fe2OG dioxygenase domain-containing protein n=1 Tax=Leptomonas pyrrhocoris TaxID=157538 RepID=A0A0M9GB77_LEPPY|nr:hypothetical protein ABB37_00826 [Leptomonas pyrrhocoris]XP_015665187.1 hypothetical protein ABB37_00826 [Leptomonas pyrrhocoris]KPA86747.1 hypothetical protein ABB37_00826 [Leptomonas pyrrhocoris]KPA86748.1 hypothetical protein ABB37_00826 [Leptomonas pyrrhocoris]|eukprot:XP_015665186.1 hypothetical protein ABB37_00826 [Leptomonas pyrrhocoris]